MDNIAHVFCAARVLRVADLEKSTEAFLTEVVLRDPSKAAVVLKVATTIANMNEAMMEGLVGHSINAIASLFSPIPELNALPSDCFSCIVRTAREMDTPKRTLEASVLGYLDSHVGVGEGAGGMRIATDEFLDVVAAPGRMDDMRFCEAVFGVLGVLLRHFREDAEAEKLCKGLHDLGFWVCLPHTVIEKAYQDRNIPDRYCTVSLMSENRHLIVRVWGWGLGDWGRLHTRAHTSFSPHPFPSHPQKVNEQLAQQVEELMAELGRGDGLRS